MVLVLRLGEAAALGDWGYLSVEVTSNGPPIEKMVDHVHIVFSQGCSLAKLTVSQL